MLPMALPIDNIPYALPHVIHVTHVYIYGYTQYKL